MNAKDKRRIDDLERRVKELEARPVPMYPAIWIVPQYQPAPLPWYQPYPFYAPTVTFSPNTSVAPVSTTTVTIS